MQYDSDAHLFNFVSGFLMGAAVGAGIALLTAPHSGRRTRRKIRHAANDVRLGAGDRWEDLSDDIKNRVDGAVKGARQKFA